MEDNTKTELVMVTTDGEIAAVIAQAAIAYLSQPDQATMFLIKYAKLQVDHGVDPYTVALMVPTVERLVEYLVMASEILEVGVTVNKAAASTLAGMRAMSAPSPFDVRTVDDEATPGIP